MFNSFINVSKFAFLKYYARTDIIGNKFYTDNVVYNSIGDITLSLLFWLIGVSIATG